MDIDFTDKVVVVTGATSSVGAECAVAFAGHNAKLTITGRDKNKLKHIAKLCEARNKFQPLCLVLDFKEKDSCESVVNRTINAFGKIDVLVNCAGEFKPSTLEENSMEIYDELMHINLRVPYNLTQLCLPHLIRTKGSVINVGSSMSKRHKLGALPYIISKTGLEKFTKHAAAELASKGVRINMISPGLVKRTIWEPFGSKSMDTDDDMANYFLIGKLVDPSEVAVTICLVASEHFPNMNGSNIVIDDTAFML